MIPAPQTATPTTPWHATARRDHLVLEHLSLVKVIARSLRQGLPQHADLDDLVQAGVVGLIAAADKFDHEKDVSFSTYAKHRIRGAMLDSLRSLDTASRDMRRNEKRVESAVVELTRLLHRSPTEFEIAEHGELAEA